MLRNPKCSFRTSFNYLSIHKNRQNITLVLLQAIWHFKYTFVIYENRKQLNLPSSNILMENVVQHNTEKCKPASIYKYLCLTNCWQIKIKTVTSIFFNFFKYVSCSQTKQRASRFQRISVGLHLVLFHSCIACLVRVFFPRIVKGVRQVDDWSRSRWDMRMARRQKRKSQEQEVSDQRGWN